MQRHFSLTTCLAVVIFVFSNVIYCEYIDDIADGQQEDQTNFDKEKGAYFQTHRDALDLHVMTFDTANVTFINEVGETFQVWMQTDICVGCKMIAVANVSTRLWKHSIAYIDTRWPTRIAVTLPNVHHLMDNETICRLYYQFGLDGVYNLTVAGSPNDSSVPECKLKIVKEPWFPFFALFIFLGIDVFFAICAIIWKFIIKKRLVKKTNIESNGNIHPGRIYEDHQPLIVPVEMKNKSTRLRSVDAFRGLAITILVFGEIGGGQYWFLMHARWYGITFADFMFPWFVFIMGTSIHLSFNILISKGRTLGSIFKKLAFRSISLFVIGVCIQPHNDLRTLRIPGVLQRFGISYFVVASSYLFSRWLQMRRKTERTGKFFLIFRDIIYYIELPVALCCLTIHLCLTFLLPVPGCPTGYQGPGGPLVGENGELTNCTGGAAGYIDRAFFGEAHIIRRSTCQLTYHTTLSNDPEGILGTFTSIALCVLGLQTGKILHLFSTLRGRLIRLIAWGLVLIACCAALTKCTLADGLIPLNKNLWSVSFICLTGGTAFLTEALFHVLIDVTKFWNGAPFFYAGMNSILLYVGSEILSTYIPFTWTPFVGNHGEYVFMAAWGGYLWLIIAYILFKKKTFLKL